MFDNFHDDFFNNNQFEQNFHIRNPSATHKIVKTTTEVRNGQRVQIVKTTINHPDGRTESYEEVKPTNQVYKHSNTMF